MKAVVTRVSSASVTIGEELKGQIGKGFLVLLGVRTGDTEAEAKKIAPTVLPAARLFPDMFPLSRQVQIACDHAKSAVARLAGIQNPKFEDSEQTLEELKTRIAQTIAFVSSVPAVKINGSEDKEVAFTAGGRDLKFTGMQYLLSYAQPNFYFHLVTAYNILRHNGVDIGKRDYIGTP